MRSYYPTPQDRADVPNVVERITHRVEKEEIVFKTLVPGWLAKKEGVLWSGGKHTLKMDGREVEAREIPNVRLDHFSMRSAGQYAIKLAAKQLQKMRHISIRGSGVDFYDVPCRVLREKGFTAFAESFNGLSIPWYRESRGRLICDPISYLGLPLRYTSPREDADALIHHLLESSERFARVDLQAAKESSKLEHESKHFTFEVASRPLPGCKVVHKFTDDATWRVLRCRLDCNAETTELHFHLCLDPGLLEIQRMTLIPAAGVGTERILEAAEIKSMLQVTSGGLAIWSYPGTACRLLASRWPLDFVMCGWNFDNAAPPCELIIEFRHDSRPLLPTILAAEVLETINSERAKLCSDLGECRAQLAAFRSSFFYEMGAAIDFTDKGNSLLYRDKGWSSPEAWGTWTDGSRATLDIRFSGMPKGPVRMYVEKAQTLIHPLHPEMPVEVGVNGSHLASWIFDSAGISTHQVEIPPGKLRDGKCGITFDIPNPASPAKLGLSDDVRRLGIGIARIVFEE